MKSATNKIPTTPGPVKEQAMRRRRAIFKFLKSYHEIHGYMPSIREISVEFGNMSTAVIYGQLNALEKKGFIQREKMISRAIRILREYEETEAHESASQQI